MNLFHTAKSFVCVVETGSFAKAAERLATSSATISRHIGHLEEKLGCRLFERTTRKLRLTESGALCLQRLSRALDEVDELKQLIQESKNQPTGMLRVSSSTQFWIQKIAPVLPKFLQKNPLLSVHVSLTERCVDLIEEGYDLALQIERPSAGTVVAKPLLRLERVLCASPQYLHEKGVPRTYTDLSDHNCLTYAHSVEHVQWKFVDNHGNRCFVDVNGNLRSTDTNTLRLAARAGLGIMRGPLFSLEEDLEAGQLVRVLPQLRSVDPDLWVVYPSRSYLSQKVRCFIDFLDEEFGTHSLRVP